MSDSSDGNLYEESNDSSDQVSWYSSDYEQQSHDLDILDKLRFDTQQLIEQQKNFSLFNKIDEKYSQNLITSLKNERYIKRSEILSKPEAFFEDLQQFRDENDKYTKNHEIKIEVEEDNNKFPPPEKCQEYMKSEKLNERYLVDDEKYYGYYSLNKRLFPVNENKCYLYPLNTNSDNKNDETSKEIDNYPIKISIKKDQFKPIKHNYHHHRRKSYDPSDSISLKSYLLKGYDHMNNPTKKKESSTLSLNKEMNGKNPKEITFNYKYYFY
ncbi:hypothetical protein BCR32DRAFT_263741 [Anaeromyces robustus]|uniref:Uncharacterized protein n=1 Tax=Anaeromyces robustus TaxID=1754192 RepID=A0A1Y1XQY8_9FUNG|nr:hypothetical protein BCR32DRAFT_263741 [Anaeromyces robustus]|eukprot:ORX88065.1 hypothetical protein BCR32DRAFT_263741 [Anaeromyces robustus]